MYRHKNRYFWGTPLGKKLPERRSALHTTGALGETRTPNLLIRSQMLYPLSYKRLGNAF